MPLRFEQKLLVPVATRPTVDRADVVTHIETAMATARVVALTAPAGWGKTTALAQWAAQSRLPVAWYTLDRADRDPHTFLDYLLHALVPFVPGLERLVTELSITAPVRLPDLYREAALEIAAASAPFAFVLDDFHAIDDETELEIPGGEGIFELIGSMIEYAPACRLVLASRTLPARQGLARMVVQQRAVVLDYQALQFRTDDVQRLARDARGLRLDEARAEELASAFGGWVAGITLSLDQADSSVPDDIATDRVYDFFAEQIIAPLEQELQAFLEESSVLEYLSVARCNALRGRDDSARFLAESRTRGFLIARRGEWLAYHSLFRDVLRARLAQDPPRERAMLRRAGDLYRADEDIERALDCYLAADAVDAAVGLLQDLAPQFLQLSRQTVLLACFERLNAHLSRRGRGAFLPPALQLIQARVYRDLALWDRAELALQLAATLGDPHIRWEATILHAELRNLQGDHQHAARLLATLPVADLPPQLQFAYHRTAGRVQIRAGAIDVAIRELEQAEQLAFKSAVGAGDPAILATLADLLGWAYMRQGNRSAALQHLQRADACWQACGNAGRRAVTLNNLGSIAMEEGRYPEAWAAFDTGIQIARTTSRRREEAALHFSSGELHLIEGNLGQAGEAFHTAYTLALQANVALEVGSSAISALWTAALCGDADAIMHWRQILDARELPEQPVLKGRRALAEALVLLRAGADAQELNRRADLAGAVGDTLIAPERLSLLLLRATIALENGGWRATAPIWETYAEQSKGLPDTLLVHFVGLFRKLFDTAAAKSPLARRLARTRRSNVPRSWQIQALGAFACTSDGVVSDLSPLHRALLAYLLDAGPKGAPVEAVWEAVWGSDSDLSMPALHQALHRLRGQTGLEAAARAGAAAIHTSRDAIVYDVWDLERVLTGHINQQSIERAMALYRGDFLPSAPLSAAYWADARRAYLRQRYLDTLETYARACEDRAPDRAIQYYQHILSIDGCREQTAVSLMQLAARAGNPSLLSDTFSQLANALRTLGLSPEPATQQLLAKHLRPDTPRLANVVGD